MSNRVHRNPPENFILTHPKFKRWKERVEKNGNRIEQLEVLSVIARDSHDFYGAFLDCALTTPEHQVVNRCVLIRGDCVVIVPVLRCREDDKIYTLLVEQRRIIDGDFSREFPAGMLDTDVGDPRMMASRELREELHLDIPPEELKPLANRPIKVITSVIGDLLHFYYFKQDVSRAFLDSMDRRSTGIHKDAEYIRVRVETMDALADHSVSSALIGIRLVERAIGRRFGSV
jgi:8-oxo-dGTP pyrophosphatase MutT (NUDIX family)